MSAQHTPGPWVASEAEGSWGVFHKWTGGCIASLEPIIERDEFEGKGDDGADARLIAAAPELLANCKWALGFFRCYLSEAAMPDELRDMAAAIAKAEGRS